MGKQTYIVKLSKADRERLNELIRKGKVFGERAIEGANIVACGHQQAWFGME